MNSEERSNEETRVDLNEWFNGEPCRDLDDRHALDLLAERLVDDIEPLLCRLAAAVARIAAVEAATRGISVAVDGNGYPTAWLKTERQPVALCRKVDVGDKVWGILVAALAASPTPIGPEPAKCEHKRTQAHQMLDEFCELTADCPGPATPEPTEETP